MPIFNWTGNPWVDTGISVIQEWTKKDIPENISIEDIENISKVLVDIYLSGSWKKNLYSVFPNNPVTNPAVKNKKQRLTEYYKNLINGVVVSGETGDCIACGRRDTVTGKNRMHIPLTGYEGSHFFSFRTNGADYCDTCTFAVQCSPLMYYACGKLLLLHSNSQSVMKYWAKTCIRDINRQIATRDFTGCFNEKYTRPLNALFHIIQDLILSYDERWVEDNASIRIYHFTNYNQGPELDIYDLPSTIFRFLAYVHQHKRYTDWIKIIRKGFYNIHGKTEEEYRNNKNSVYQSLLSGRSILGYFLNTKVKSVIGDWSLLKYYLKEVLGMEEKRIEAIRNLADDIAKIIKTSANGKKRLGQIERSASYAGFRNVLLRLTKDTVALKTDTPLFIFDDYAKHLFPDGALRWKETQDMLLFRLYEILHNWLVSEGLVTEEIEESEEVVIS